MSIQMKEQNAPYFGKLSSRMNHFRESVLTKSPILMQSELCLRQKRIRNIKISPVQ